MSRKWERMVERNTEQLNKRRKKQGKSMITIHNDLFMGRNIILPIGLLSVALFYAYFYSGQNESIAGSAGSTTWYWIIICSYSLLAVILFFKKPYLKVDKEALRLRRFNKELRLTAGQIKEIEIKANIIVITPKYKGRKWRLSKIRNRYDLELIAKRLDRFANENHILLK